MASRRGGFRGAGARGRRRLWTIESQATGTNSWHEVYRRFGTNPKRMRPSMEALARRLDRKHELPRISGAVDSYNAVSVRHGVPAGAFDLDGLPGDVVVRRADAASDEFVPLGEPDAVERPTDGEVVYASGNRILTRSWNYRDSDLTKVVPALTSIVFMVERATAGGKPPPSRTPDTPFPGPRRPDLSAYARAGRDRLNHIAWPL